MKLRVYVESKFEHSKTARAVMTLVEELGHEITWDWSNENADGLEGVEREAYLKKCGDQDVSGVLTCNVFFMIPHHNGYGLMTELGIALASGKRILIAGPVERETPFLSLARCERFASVTEALNALGPA
jgi:hypothetical protein